MKRIALITAAIGIALLSACNRKPATQAQSLPSNSQPALQQQAALASNAPDTAVASTVALPTSIAAIQQQVKRYNLEQLSIRIVADSLFVAQQLKAEKPNLSHYHVAQLNVPIGAVDPHTPLHIQPLGSADLPELDPGLVNVTTLEGGFRFLPHGTQFAQAAQVSLSFDSTLIPAGYTTEDIRTFYYDEHVQGWQLLPKDTLNGTMLASLTTHFTDMINGILKVPETPATAAYTPTSISELKAADPSLGVTLIQAPQANSSGSANLQYPLQLPAGRAGMTPNLALSYSSEGGNGWLGHGWSLSTSTVSVESRWGVPRFLAAEESETYLIDGQQLSPVAHRAAYVARTGEKQFYPRVEGSFSRIIRHGSSPSGYWWEVTATNGSRSFYGGTPESGVASEAVLTDKDGNIAQWSLTEVRDLNGNRIRYRYTKTTEAFLTTGENVQQQVLQRIEYAAFGSEPAPYKVEFTVKNDREDVQVSARQGFLQQKNTLLDEVKITVNGTPLRSYRMGYTTGAFNKTLLEKVETFDSEGQLFYTHTFDYYNDLGADLYGPEQAFTPPSEGLDAGFINPLAYFSDHMSAISGSKSWGASGGGGVHIGVAFLPGLLFSAGGNYTYSYGETEGVVSMLDLNGDGIPDKLYKKADDRLYYRPGQAGSSQFFGDEVMLVGAPANFLRSKSNTNSAGFSANAIATVGYNKGWTKSKTDVYLADFNSDGLPDIAYKGAVYFNRLVGGHPTFETTSANTYNPIQASGAVDPALLPDADAETAEQKERNPLHNSVRLWRAPYSGTIQVNAPVQLMAALDPTVEGYDTRDGVRAALEFRNSELWSVVIGADDVAPRSCVQTLTVNAGEELYFRLQAVVNGACDHVQWSPDIRYTTITSPTIPLTLEDPNSKYYSRFNAANDFVLSATQPLGLPKDGRVEVSMPIDKPIMSDDVELRVYYTEEGASPVLAYTQTVAAGTAVNTIYTFQQNVKAKSTLDIKLYAGTNVLWEAIECLPTVRYLSLDDAGPMLDSHGNPMYNYDVLAEYTMYSRHLKHGAPYVADTTLTMHVLPLLTFADTTKATGSFTFSVKGINTLYASKTYTLDAANLLYSNGTYLRPTSPLDTLIIHPTEGDVLYVEYHVDSLAYAQQLTTAAFRLWIKKGDGTTLDSLTANAGLYASEEKPWFGHLYRGWGQFSYNEQAEYSTAPMDMTAVRNDIVKLETNPGLPSDPSTLSHAQLEALESSLYNSSTARYLTMTADRKTGRYVGYDPSVFVGAAEQGAGRMGMKDVIVQPFSVAAGRFPAISKQMKSENKTTSLGVTVGFAGATKMRSESETRYETDMVDLNGDGYPDLLGKGSIQYTGVLGGFYQNETHTLPDLIATANANGVGADATSMPAKAFNALPNIIKAADAMAKAKMSISLNGSLGDGTDRSEAEWVDVNGDGLPDRAYPDGTVELNLGYRFTPRVAWQTTLTTGTMEDKGAGLGVSPFSGFSAGVGLSRSDSKGLSAMLDINGDGLPDRISTVSSNSVSVQYNTGIGYSAPQTINLNFLQEGVGTGESANASGTIPINVLWFFRIAINLQAAAQHGAGRERVMLTDMNGDGIPDYVYSDKENELKVRYAQTGRINLLKTVHQPLGSTIGLDYAQTAPSVDDPNVRWTLSSVAVYDGLSGDGADVQKLAFTYEHPRYDRFERTALGFATVTTTQLDTENGDAPYRRTVQRYLNSNYYQQGMLYDECTLTAAGDTLSRTQNSYRMFDPSSMTPATFSPFFSGRLYPALMQSIGYTYEDGPPPTPSQGGGFLAMEKTFAYDDYGNIVTYVETPLDGLPPSGGGGASLTVSVGYRHDNSRYQHALPETFSLTTAQGELRRRTATYDSRGNLTQLNQLLDGGQNATMDFAYDPYGNLTRVTRPANYKGQRLWYTFTYDDVLHQLVTKVEDAYGYSSSTEYSTLWAAPLKATDLNGTAMEYAYDAKGRQETVSIAPQSPQGGAIVAGKLITFSYPATFVSPPSGGWGALTLHHTPEGDIATYTFVDGLARAVQVKKTSVVMRTAPTEETVLVVSGKTMYDAFGRATATGQPLTETLGSETTLNSAALQHPTTVSYDHKDRPLTQTLPDGAVTSTSYVIADGLLRQRITDPLGRISEAYTNLRQHTLKTVRKSAGGNVQTLFEYNPLGELLQVTDPLGSTSHVTYDKLGRTLSTQHPDAGLTVLTYDAAGNLLKKVTEELAQTLSDGGGVTYTYDYERPLEVIYPKSIYNRITYSYGAPDAKNGRAGRLTLVQDASGGQEYFYDALGNVTKTIRSVIASKNEVLTYISGSEYDAWGRLRTMTYPDGEQVDYTYNAAGELSSFKGKKDGREYLYLEQNGYDQFGHLIYQKMGNGTKQLYEYEEQRQRLMRMQLYSGDSLLMDNKYAYDAVDNILSIANDTLSRHAYSYDDLNRLITAVGRAKGASYTLGMSYDLMGKPTRKNQMTQGSSAGTHDWAYAYTGSKPNAVTQIGTKIYTYDGNGNPTGWEDGEKYRRMAWDEENRLTAVEDNAYLSRYVYDHTGERVVKTHSGSSGIMVNGVSQGTLTHNENTTLYVSPYFTVGKNGNEFTKHYFAGSQRVASKLGNGRFNNYFRPGIYGLTAGGVNYIERMQSIAQSKEDYMKNNGIAPGPPHMKGIYADPNFSGISYPDGGTPSNTYVPVGWPRKVVPLKDKDPNAAPGAPIQYYQTINNETVEPGFAYEGGGQIEESGRYFYHGDHLGSTGYVTDARGRVSQYVAYMPYGETLFEQHSNTREMPYLFNGKEKDEETGLYYYGARYYDAEMATWMGVDPLAGKYSDIGGYVYCMGNPVNLVDPNGMEVEEKSQKQWGKQKNSIIKTRDKLQSTINNLTAKAAEKNWSAEKLAGKIGNMQDRVSGLNGAISNLGALEASTQMYSLNSGATRNEVSYDVSTGNIVISYSGTALFTHETTHAGQFETGDIAFNSANGAVLGQDIYDEVAGYKAQWAYAPASVGGLNSSNQITPSWVQSVTEPGGNQPYKPGGTANTGISPVNVNSSKNDLIKAYPHQKSTLQGLPANATLKSTIPTMHYKKNRI